MKTYINITLEADLTLIGLGFGLDISARSLHISLIVLHISFDLERR